MLSTAAILLGMLVLDLCGNGLIVEGYRGGFCEQRPAVTLC